MKRLYIAIAILALASTSMQAQKSYDLLLTGGRVIDPANHIDAVMDVAVANHRIAAVAPHIDPSLATKTVDVSGLYVTPGLVDIHVHVYASTGEANSYAGDNAVFPDGFTFRVGVTTVADAGCSGSKNFEDFKAHIIDRSKTRVLAFLNIVGAGMRGPAYEQNVAEMDSQAAATMAKKYPGLIVGIKTAHYAGPEWVAVDRAEEAGTLANIPVMVDFGTFRPERPYQQLVLNKMRPGDISTHMYLDWVPDAGRAAECAALSVRGAQARGDLRRGPRRRKLSVSPGCAGSPARMDARLDLYRSAHWQHEQRDAGHAQRHVEVSEYGRSAS